MSIKLLTSIMAMFITLSAFSNEECGEIQIRFVNNQETQTQSIKGCILEKESDLFLTSPECSSFKCPAIIAKDIAFISLKDYVKSVGSPGFKVCRELKGEPRIVEFKHHKKWYDSDLCRFKNGSFVSTNVILKTWKERIIW